MSWKNDRAKYEVEMSGKQADMSLWVTGAMDETESNRAKLILEEHSQNKGPSLGNEEARSKAIDSLSKSMGIDARDADWYVLDERGKLTSLEVQNASLTKENPSFTELRDSGDLSRQELAEAQKHFPDVKEERLVSAEREVSPRQDRELGEAFGGLERQSSNQQEQAQPQDVNQQSAHEYDLSQERM